MDPLNLACFSQPHWRVIARGMDTEKWFNDGEGVGTGGISMPQPSDLPVGQKYYRFANSTSSREAQLGGGWWIDFENYNTIRRYAQSHDLGLSYAARLFLALPVNWTRVDRLVSATLEVPLRAYTGKGAVVVGAGEKWTPVQHVLIRQLYIPGLYVPHGRHQLYEKAFPKPHIEMILNR